MKLLMKTVLVCASALAAPAAAIAQDVDKWPEKAVVLIVPYSPGGGTDILARMIGAKLSEIWKQTVVVENKAGANGIIGSAEIMRARPDGYKIMLVVGSHIINKILTKNVPYDPQTDFTPITRFAVSPSILAVKRDGKFADLPGFIEAGKKQDVSVGYSEGQTQLTGELIRQATAIKAVPVPYKGGSPLMVDIVGGHVDSGVTSVLTVLPYVKSGQLKVIAVAADKPLDVFPDAVTFAQTGHPEVESLSWYGFFGPKNMPAAIVSKINDSLLTATQDPKIAAQLKAQGATVTLDKPAAFRQFLESEKHKWQQVANKGGITAR
ncbi:MAG: Bug family tripartite tricarboxylate transporter substrate binding protein [Advenella sp.]